MAKTNKTVFVFNTVPRLVPVLHVVWMVRHLLDHLLQQVVAGEHRVQLAVMVLALKQGSN